MTEAEILTRDTAALIRRLKAIPEKDWAELVKFTLAASRSEARADLRAALWRVQPMLDCHDKITGGAVCASGDFYRRCDGCRAMELVSTALAKVDGGAA